MLCLEDEFGSGFRIGLGLHSGYGESWDQGSLLGVLKYAGPFSTLTPKVDPGSAGPGRFNHDVDGCNELIPGGSRDGGESVAGDPPG